MNLSMWSAIREYIAAEVRLGILRFQRESGQPENVRRKELATLEAQSTRMETAVRGHVEEFEKWSKTRARVPTVFKPRPRQR